MLSSVLRLHIEAAHDHRFSVRAVRSRLHLHKINLGACTALRSNLEESDCLTLHKHRKAVLRICPVLVEIRLHIRSRHHVIWRDSECEVARSLLVDHTLGLVETRRKVLCGGHIDILLSLCRNLVGELDHLYSLALVGRDGHLHSSLHSDSVDVLSLDDDLRSCIPYPVVDYRHIQFEEFKLLRFLLFRILVVRLRCHRLCAADESHCDKRNGRKENEWILLHFYVYLISFLIFCESSAFS